MLLPSFSRGASKMAALRRGRRLSRRYWTGLLWLGLLAFCLLQPLLQSSQDGGDGLPRRLSDDDDSMPAVRDAFSVEQRRQGAVILHCIGLLYTFVAIALVCDECFVPALEVIIDVFSLSPDVAGATFMAAGGSAPEFFTSLIGAFSKSDVGTGTIIGSAVFNVLFVIGACALAAKKPLELTWFPLARDSIFYAVSLIVVTGFFLDGKIMWFEALVLFTIYLAYVTFMRFNPQIEAWATGNPIEVVEVVEETAGDAADVAPDEERPAEAWAKARDDAEVPNIAVDSAHLQPPGVLRSDERKGTKDSNGVQRSTSKRSHLCPQSDVRKKFRHHSHQNRQGGSKDPSASKNFPAEEDDEAPESKHPPPAHGGARDNANPAQGQRAADMDTDLMGVVPQAPPAPSSEPAAKVKPEESRADQNDKPASSKDEEDDEDDEDDEPLSLAPPTDGSALDWVTYITKLPILVCLVFTVPDVRRQSELPGGLTWKKLWPLTFIMSILWIAVFVYVMVWLVERVAEAAHLADKEHIMGLTILAAGTSVPDFLTSVIVAREGHGDMAISSSIGSNIFDVTVGLPIPWLLYSMAYSGDPVLIKNQGLEVNVLLLLAMLGVTIGSIKCHGWVMTRLMGFSMLLLYVLFVIVSVILASLPDGSLKLIKVD